MTQTISSFLAYLNNKKNKLLHLIVGLSLLSCTTIKIHEYNIPTIGTPEKSESITYELVEILNQGQAYKTSPEEFQKTEDWLRQALEGAGYSDVKRSKAGGTGVHLKIKIDVHNPPWYMYINSILLSFVSIGTLGIVPVYSGEIQHIFHFEASKSGKPSKTFQIDGPILVGWWGWLAPFLGDRDAEAQIINSWKLIIKKGKPNLTQL
jgi:hypothetical protein